MKFVIKHLWSVSIFLSILLTIIFLNSIGQSAAKTQVHRLLESGDLTKVEPVWLGGEMVDLTYNADFAQSFQFMNTAADAEDVELNLKQGINVEDYQWWPNNNYYYTDQGTVTLGSYDKNNVDYLLVRRTNHRGNWEIASLPIDLKARSAYGSQEYDTSYISGVGPSLVHAGDQLYGITPVGDVFTGTASLFVVEGWTDQTAFMQSEEVAVTCKTLATFDLERGYIPTAVLSDQSYLYVIGGWKTVIEDDQISEQYSALSVTAFDLDGRLVNQTKIQIDPFYGSIFPVLQENGIIFIDTGLKSYVFQIQTDPDIKENIHIEFWGDVSDIDTTYAQPAMLIIDDYLYTLDVAHFRATGISTNMNDFSVSFEDGYTIDSLSWDEAQNVEFFTRYELRLSVFNPVGDPIYQCCYDLGVNYDGIASIADGPYRSSSDRWYYQLYLREADVS